MLPGRSYLVRVQAIDRVGQVSEDWATSDLATLSIVTKYYYFGSQRIAMRQGDEVYYFTGDHLGSVSLTTDSAGSVVDERRYLPYGGDRWSKGSAMTDFGFTGQRNEAGFGLLDYNARYYSPVLGRFISPDSIVPEPGGSQGFNRYSYVYNNPLRYIDPTGHLAEDELRTLLGDEYDTMMKTWEEYDPYWIEVLTELQAGDTLYASELDGVSLFFRGEDGYVGKNANVIGTQVLNGIHTDLIKHWQGKGVYTIQRPGESPEWSAQNRDEMFDKQDHRFNTITSPQFKYSYGNTPEYLGSIRTFQSIDSQYVGCFGSGPEEVIVNIFLLAGSTTLGVLKTGCDLCRSLQNAYSEPRSYSSLTINDLPVEYLRH